MAYNSYFPATYQPQYYYPVSQLQQAPAQIRAGQVEEVDALYNRLSSCPVPTMPVYGSQPIFTCPQNNGCGCGNNF